jgi:antitoxin MazE
VRTRISKWGNSLAVRIPKTIAIAEGLLDGVEVEVTSSEGSIILTPVLPQFALRDLVEGITPENRHDETDWGTPGGAEVW